MMFPMYDAIRDLQTSRISFTVTNSPVGMYNLLFDVVIGGELEKVMRGSIERR